MFSTRLVLLSMLCLGFRAAAAQTANFVAAQPLPSVEIDGTSVKIHTQGLYATEDDYLVTGRVDTLPRRAVVLRFPRGDLTQYESLDLTPTGQQQAVLNHPGGFDRDSEGVFWIPLSTSNSRGPTTVLGLSLWAGKLPASRSQLTKSFQISDHLGAICCLEQGRLLAANWDTKLVYLIDSAAGAVLQKFSHDDFFGSDSGIRLAVQDWKYDRDSKLVIAGGIDKSASLDSQSPNAVIAWIDPARRKLVSSIRLKPRDDVARPLTNEGLALDGSDLFLLPEDFGKGAKILRFSIVR